MTKPAKPPTNIDWKLTWREMCLIQDRLEARAEAAEALVRQLGEELRTTWESHHFDYCTARACQCERPAVLRDPLAVRLMEGRDGD